MINKHLEDIILKKSIKRCCICAVACSVLLGIIFWIDYNKVTTQLVSKDEVIENTAQGYEVTFKKSTDKIAMYGTKLFYSESDDAVTAFYVYDFENKTRDEIFDMPKFMLRGRSYTFIEDIIYFYLGVDTGKNIKNVLYAMDFSEQKMFPVNENIYAQKLIPLINVNEQLFALQGDRDESGNVKFWIEKSMKMVQ